ncbi:MAG: single-stranded DNA-binding protein [Pirellulales bacterium]
MAAKKAAAPKQSAVVKKASVKGARVKTDSGNKKDSGGTETAALVTEAAAQLRDAVDRLRFEPQVPWVYNPLHYAWAAHEQYIARYARPTCEVLFLGMNPGPWGMAQTGVPFGQIAAVRDWLNIDADIEKPRREHPKRPIEGLACERSEVSGERLWGLFQARFGSPDRFFERHFVANYCPLVFMEESARNLTPDKLPRSLAEPLEAVCDAHLAALCQALRPQWIIGVGAFAEACGERVVQSCGGLREVQVGRILHPSPASPAANRDWAGTASKQLEALGIW